MTRLNAANNAQTKLTAGIAAGDTSFYVNDGTVLPSAPFVITVENEIIRVNAKAGNLCSSVTRGYDGTIAAAHIAETAVENRFTKAMYDGILSPEDVLTISQSTAPTGNTGTISSIFGYLANRIKAITGKTNWYDNPSKTLEDVNTHIGALITSESAHGLKIETGNWTPTIAGSTTAGTNTYSTQSGSYYKIGKFVVATFIMQLSAKDAAMAGNALMAGLPFTPTVTYAGALIGGYGNIDLDTGFSQLSLITIGGATSCQFRESGDSVAWQYLTVSAFAANAVIYGSIMFWTA